MTRGLLALALGAGLLLGAVGCTKSSSSTGGTLGKLEVHTSPAGQTFTNISINGAASLKHPPGQTIVFMDWQWTVDGMDSGITTRDLDKSQTTKHEVWQLSAVADTGSGITDRAYSDPVEILNSPPNIRFLTIPFSRTFPPTEPPTQRHCENDPATVTKLIQDADGDVPTETYEWRVNGTLVATQMTTSPSLDPSFFAAGDAVMVTLTADDGEATSTKNSQPVTMVTCPPPTVAAAGLVSGGLVTGGRPATAFFSGAGMSAVGSGGVEATVLLPQFPADAPNAPVTSLAGAGDAPTAPLSVTESNVCSIGADGSLLCTGSDAFGLDQPPAGAFSQVKVELDYACAIRADDGTIACWGRPAEDLGQLAPPEGAFASLDLGVAAACGVQTTGEVACWGDPSLGLSPAPEGPFTHVDVTDADACAIRADGEVVCWGGAE